MPVPQIGTPVERHGAPGTIEVHIDLLGRAGQAGEPRLRRKLRLWRRSHHHHAQADQGHRRIGGAVAVEAIVLLMERAKAVAEYDRAIQLGYSAADAETIDQANRFKSAAYKG